MKPLRSQYVHGSRSLSFFAFLLPLLIPEFAKKKIDIHIENVNQNELLLALDELEFLKHVCCIKLLIPMNLTHEYYSMTNVNQVISQALNLQQLSIILERELEQDERKTLEMWKERGIEIDELQVESGTDFMGLIHEDLIPDLKL